MFNITIIFTAHKEIGKCNSRELLRIIEKYKPEVIFEEISSAVFDQCYGIQNRFTLETNAIKLYLEKGNVIHIPVVSNELADVVSDKYEILTADADCRYLIDRLCSQEENQGFGFLNSNASASIFANLKLVEESIILHSKDEKLKSIFARANRNIDQYEDEIIENVYEYCVQNNFNKGLLFLGAAHKKSVQLKLQNYNDKVDFKINWSFYNEK